MIYTDMISPVPFVLKSLQLQFASKRLFTGLIFGAALIGLLPKATATPIVNLGSASGFAVLAGAGITAAGPANSTTIHGDIGSFPTQTITGVGNLSLNGVNHGGDSVTQQGKADLLTAFNDATGRVPTVTFGAIHDLGGATLTSGVYNDPTSFGLTGTLTLDGGGNPNAVWIFQAGTTLITAGSSQVVLTGGAQASHVFWEVGTSATLGTDSQFAGTILAFSDISLTTGATVEGRLLAWNGAVTLDHNTINAASVPDAGATVWLLGSGLLALAFVRGSAQLGRQLQADQR